MAIKIGKSVIESLTTGMYENAFFIFREYIQNSVDQIDKALQSEILRESDEGVIHITLDKEKEIITVEDNATGVESGKVQETLGNIALSEKDSRYERGFRGIGRLGGLAYCDQFIFETSYYGESVKTIMTWDAKKLKQNLYDRNVETDASPLIDSVITVEKQPGEENQHYFKVIMEGVNQCDLLEEDKVREYLAMVAPLPFETSFWISEKINKYFDNIKKPIEHYVVYLNTQQLYKSYKSDIKDAGNKISDVVYDVEFFNLEDNKGGLLAVGWHGLMEFNTAIHSGNVYRGLRLRKGNIGIGDQHTLRKFFKEERGNSYFIGEIHVFDDDLIPNGRRDYFIDNEKRYQLEKKIRLRCIELHQLYHEANKAKNAVKAPKELEEERKNYEEKRDKGSLQSPSEKEKLEQKIDSLKEKSEKGKKELTRIQKKYPESHPIHRVVTRHKKVHEYDNNTKMEPVDAEKSEPKKIKWRTDTTLSHFKKNERKIVQRIYCIIDEVITPPALAEQLKSKIEEELQAGKNT